MSELIGRELVEAIDALIQLRIKQHSKDEHSSFQLIGRDDAEMIKRILTDAFLAMDSRKGVYVSGSPIHSCKP